jgi:uncharacterized membrane protein YhdT
MTRKHYKGFLEIPLWLAITVVVCFIVIVVVWYMISQEPLAGIYRGIGNAIESLKDIFSIN